MNRAVSNSGGPQSAPIARIRDNEAEASPTWFIFTTGGRGFSARGTTITSAVAEWRRAKHRDAGEIVGVIRGAMEGSQIGRIVQAPCFGVIVCVQESGTDANDRPNLVSARGSDAA